MLQSLMTPSRMTTSLLPCHLQRCRLAKRLQPARTHTLEHPRACQTLACQRKNTTMWTCSTCTPPHPTHTHTTHRKHVPACCACTPHACMQACMRVDATTLLHVTHSHAGTIRHVLRVVQPCLGPVHIQRHLMVACTPSCAAYKAKCVSIIHHHWLTGSAATAIWCAGCWDVCTRPASAAGARSVHIVHPRANVQPTVQQERSAQGR